MKKIIIIGSGIGGLAASCLLAKDGYEVTVLEKNAHAGGRANVFTQDGFRFDMGPSWYLMPDVFEDFFKRLGKNIHEYLSLEKLTPSYRVFFEDKTYYDISTDVDTLGNLFESWEPGAKKQLTLFLQKSEYAYHIAMKDFVYKNYNSLFDFFNLRLLTDAGKLPIFTKMEQYIEKFFTDPRIKQIMQYTLVFLGGSPKNTPAIYSIMSHIDFNMGVWYPKNGMYEIPKALEGISKEFGTTFHYDSEVSEILIDEKTKKAIGVRLASGEILHADIVISNGDYHHTETALLPPQARQYSASYWDKKVQSPSAFILYLGTNKKIESLQHHNLFFAKDWDKHFADIFDQPTWPQQPSIYIGCPSKTDATVAPENGENIFILVPIASGLTDTPEIRSTYEERIISMLEQWTGETIKDHLVVRRSFSLKDFQKEYFSHKGSALGLAHTLFQTAIFRPRNQSKKVKNLFYTGGNTIPGIGVPMCLISSILTSERIHHYE